MNPVDPIPKASEEAGDASDQPRLKNTYYLYPRRGPIPWDPLDEKQDIEPHAAFFSKVFVAMEQHLKASGLTFYLTWDIDSLPSHGDDVVAVVLDDEWSRIPRYFDRVLAVFKTHGARLPLGDNFFRKPTYLNFLSLVRFLRIQLYRVPGLMRYAAARIRAALRPAGVLNTDVFHIPLGYANQQDLPIKDFSERRYDLYFSGSVDNAVYPIWAPQRWLQTPKSYARRKMVGCIEALQRTRPDLRIELDVMPFYAIHLTEEEKGTRKRSYSEEMMDTKVCVVPRGTTLETSRLYEGLRYGCIVISETLPPEWYLEDIPAIQLEDWDDLEGVMAGLFEDEARLRKRHEASLAWWRSRGSEAAIGRYLAEQLNAKLVHKSR